MKNFEIKKNGNSVIVAISGRLDTLTASQLDKETQNLLDSSEQSLTIDLTNLSYTSSSGLRCFVRLFNEAKAVGAQFKIEGLQPSIREIFEITRVSKIFGI